MKRGIQLEHQYEYLPYPVRGSSPFQPGYISVEGIQVVSHKAMIYRHLNIGCEVLTMDRSGKINYDLW